MKGLIGLLVVAAISVGAYMMFLQQAAPAPGMVATQTISVVGVKNDLLAIAHAEQMYYAQYGSYADLQTLLTKGVMNIARTSRDGYTYSVDPEDNGFTATARYTAPIPEMPKGAAPPHFPTFTIDQTMQIHQGE